MRCGYRNVDSRSYRKGWYSAHRRTLIETGHQLLLPRGHPRLQVESLTNQQLGRDMSEEQIEIQRALQEAMDLRD